MFADRSKLPPRWVRNSKGFDGVDLTIFEIGPPVSVNSAYPWDRLADDGYVGIYRRKKPCEIKREVARMIDDAASFDDLDLFGDGG